EEQTACIVEALFSDLLGEDESDCQNLETDWGAVVTSRLRRMGDQCNMDFERASSEALAEGKAQTASRCLQMEKFGAAVDSLSSSWSDQNPTLVYERAFLCVSVKLLLHVAKKVPAMVHPNQLTKVINGNSQVRNYIEACGGWVRM
ncbi:Bcl-2-like 15, partial [Cariama cristata]